MLHSNMHGILHIYVKEKTFACLNLENLWKNEKFISEQDRDFFTFYDISFYTLKKPNFLKSEFKKK